MIDVLTGATCNFEDEARRRQDIAKDIQNKIAIACRGGRVLAVIGHLRSASNLLWPRLRNASLRSFLRIRFESLVRHHCRNNATYHYATKARSVIAWVSLQ